MSIIPWTFDSSFEKQAGLLACSLFLAEGPSKQDDVWTGRSRTGVLVLWPVEGKEYAVGQKVNVVIDTAQTWLVKGKALD